MSKKTTIKPVHLVLVGLAIIILGILIPSFFINAFSTIGFAIIIGCLILLSAYAFFAVNLVRSKGKKTIKWLALPVILALLIGGGLFANYKHLQYLDEKIYSVGDTVKMQGFDFKVSKVDFSKVPLDTKNVNLSDRKDCNQVPKDEKGDCDWYNWPRRNAQDYINGNYRATISYEVTADNEPIQGHDVSINVLPDSGRELAYNVDESKQTGSNEEFSFLWVLDLPYTLNPRSDFGGAVNRGITRKGTIGVDLKNSEQVFDVVVKYHGKTRVVRISK